MPPSKKRALPADATILPDLIPAIVEAGGFQVAAVAVLINHEWRDAALPTLEKTNPLKLYVKYDWLSQTQGGLQEKLALSRKALLSTPGVTYKERRRHRAPGFIRIFESDSIMHILRMHGGLPALARRMRKRDARRERRQLLESGASASSS